MASDNIARVKPNSGEHYRIGRSVTRSAGGTSGHVGVRFLKGIQHRTTSATSQKDEILWNQWINAWFTQRNQQVCVDGEMSGMKPVRSGVPHRVLGPLCFLLYINDIGDLISPRSSIRLFTDDSLLY
jgi:hypothetical protein